MHPGKRSSVPPIARWWAPVAAGSASTRSRQGERTRLPREPNGMVTWTWVPLVRRDVSWASRLATEVTLTRDHEDAAKPPRNERRDRAALQRTSGNSTPGVWRQMTPRAHALNQCVRDLRGCCVLRAGGLVRAA